MTLEAAAAFPAESRARTFAGDAVSRLRKSPGAVIGAIIVAAIVILALGAPLFAHADPLAQDLTSVKMPPSAAHLLGTDALGRDVFARTLYGARISIAIGFVSVALAMALGVVVGVVAGYDGGRTDGVLMSAMDLMLAFPSIVLAIGITTVLGRGIGAVMIAVGIVYVPQYARLARSSVLAAREREFVEAARAIGASTVSVVARHILPNILAPLLVQATLGIATAELDAAGLSYLGLGARPPTAEWGAMLADAHDYWLAAPWALIVPGVAITILVLGFNLLGDGLRDAIDPTAK